MLFVYCLRKTKYSDNVSIAHRYMGEYVITYALQLTIECIFCKQLLYINLRVCNYQQVHVGVGDHFYVRNYDKNVQSRLVDAS